MRGIKVQKSHVKSSIIEKTGGVCAVCGRPLVHSKVTIEHYSEELYQWKMLGLQIIDLM